MSVLSAISQTHWAMRESVLLSMMQIASRQNGGVEAIEKELGKKLDNTHDTYVRDGVAVISIVGPLMRYANLFSRVSGATSYDILARDFATALGHDDVKSILLNVNSPGGAVDGCNEFADMIFAARGRKQITAYVGGEACSAGFWIASAADKIVADETAIVGSIGVCASVSDSTKQQQEDGIEERMIVSSGAPRKNLGANGITDESVAALVATLNGLEAVFHAKVARNRNVSERVVRANYGKGGVFVAGSAADGEKSGLDAGLVDSIGSFESVLTEMSKGSSATVADMTPMGAASHSQNLSAVASANAVSPPHAEETSMDPKLLEMLSALNATITSQHGESMAAHAATQAKTVAPVATPPVAAVELPSEILAMTGKSGPEAVGIVAAWKQAFDSLPTLSAENDALKSQVAARERSEIIEGALRSGKLKPAMKGWAEKTDLTALRSFVESAPADSAPYREPPTTTGTNSVNTPGSITATADQIPTDPALKKAFLSSEFAKLPESERKAITKDGTDPVAYMERRIARSTNGSVQAYGPRT